MAKPDPMSPEDQPYTTIEVASLLGLAVRSVQLMVDRGELDAWKTPGVPAHLARPRWSAGWPSAAAALYAPADAAPATRGGARGVPSACC